MARKTSIERYRNIGIAAMMLVGPRRTCCSTLVFLSKIGEVHDGAATMTGWNKSRRI